MEEFYDGDMVKLMTIQKQALRLVTTLKIHNTDRKKDYNLES